MAGGRTPKYDADTVEKAEEYLTIFTDDGSVVPSVAGLALHLNIGRRTCQEWAADPEKPEFSRTLEKLKAIQEQILLNSGLKGEFSAPITKLLLHNHGYTDKSTQEVTGSDGGPLKHTLTVEYVQPEPKG